MTQHEEEIKEIMEMAIDILWLKKTYIENYLAKEDEVNKMLKTKYLKKYCLTEPHLQGLNELLRKVDDSAATRKLELKELLKLIDEQIMLRKAETH